MIKITITAEQVTDSSNPLWDFGVNVVSEAIEASVQEYALMKLIERKVYHVTDLNKLSKKEEFEVVSEYIEILKDTIENKDLNDPEQPLGKERLN